MGNVTSKSKRLICPFNRSAQRATDRSVLEDARPTQFCTHIAPIVLFNTQALPQRARRFRLIREASGMARIMVTGASGYIGNVLVDLLLKENHQVVAVDWMVFGGFPLKPFAENPNFELLRQDIRTIPVGAFRGVDMICDVSGLPNEPCGALDPILTREINFQARARLSRIAKAMGIRRHIVLTSCETYEVPKDQTATEQSPLSSRSSYAKCNIQLEDSVLSATSEAFCASVLRVGAVYGLSRRMRFDNVANLIALHAYTGRNLTLSGSERNTLPFIHVRDVARAILATLGALEEKVSGQVFNLASQCLTFGELLSEAERVFTEKMDVRFAPSTETYPESTVSLDTLGKATGFSPRITIDQGLLEVLIALKGVRTHVDETTNTAKFYRSVMKKGAESEARRLT